MTDVVFSREKRVTGVAFLVAPLAWRGPFPPAFELDAQISAFAVTAGKSLYWLAMGAFKHGAQLPAVLAGTSPKRFAVECFAAASLAGEVALAGARTQAQLTSANNIAAAKRQDPRLAHNAMAHDLYTTGVVSPRPRATRADEMRAEAIAWSIDRPTLRVCS